MTLSRYTAALFALLLAAGGALRAEAQIYRLPHADTTSGTFFGTAVAISGDRVLVGASAEDACGPQSGAAYVFERDPATDTWAEAARLTASDCSAGDFFGRDVALDGDIALVAAAETVFNTGATNAAYVFERDTSGTWRQTARFTGDLGAEEGAFATSVALEGTRAVVTTSGDASGGRFGGAAYVFERDARTGRWARTARLTSPGGVRAGIFGGSAVLSGDRIAVASSAYFRDGPGSVFVFRRGADGAWTVEKRFDKIDDVFISLALDGDDLLIGESRDGRRKAGLATVHTFEPPGRWRENRALEPRHPYEYGAFGTLVSILDRRLLVVGYDEQLGLDFNADRVVYAFVYDPERGDWRQTKVVDIGESDFAASIDQDGPFAVIGEASEQEPGAAYIVRLE